MRRILLIALPALASIGAGVVSAQSWAVDAIPEELKRGADAVVRISETEFEYVSPTLARERGVKVVTVLKRAGIDEGNFESYSDEFRSFSGFSGEIYDASGKLFRKIKSSELLYTDYSRSGFADDMRTHYCYPNLPNPPFTVKYEWEITTRNGVWAFPPFSPRDSESIGVEKAQYRLSIPDGVKFRSKAYNIEPTYSSTESKGKVTHTWSVANLLPATPEPFRNPPWERYPVIYFSPDEFIYDGVAGSMKDWPGYALWQWQLLDRSSSVPAELKATVANLTKDAGSDLEKIRRLHKYLGETTRYVSIQIGIGGFQPMPIEEVCRTGYGDCKALSNYLRMMLAECGIESHYVEIGMNRRSIPRDFATPYTSNHAIVMVPMGADTLWVECTDPRLPLGYRHDGIVGQNALVYANGTASVVTVPRYDDSLNLSSRHADVTLRADGGASAHVATVNRLHRYESLRSFVTDNATDRLNTLRGQVNIPVAWISDPSFREDKSPIPSIAIEYDLTTASLGSRTGDRVFVPAVMFRKPSTLRFGRSQRKNEICVTQGALDHDITKVELPGTLRVETVPEPVKIESKYGEYSLVCRTTETGVEIERRFLLRTGSWGSGEYSDFRSFIETVLRSDGAKIVLTGGQESQQD
ncbi:MAG: transglutaminase-like domain-containing protein [Alistipes sp.]|jgi:hypothetical protein|nr:transglutaminase-like domain-containing protein [Alistipes sp.]